MKILIIKLGALGDVLRTTPLLPALKNKYPNSKISWLVDGRHQGVLEKNSFIDKLFVYSPQIILDLPNHFYDLAINLDKDEEALDSITAVNATQKIGFGRGADGLLCALDDKSQYAYQLGIDDELKFRKNQKTYQEICFEQVGLKFEGQDYDFKLNDKSLQFAIKHLESLGAVVKNQSKLTIGLNTGSGVRFAGKKLPVNSIVRLAEKFYTELDAQVFLLGGEDEIQRNQQIQKLSKVPLINTGSHSIFDFAAIVKHCDLIVSGDTTAMHIAIATKVPVVAYFGSTCASEIELYGRGRKIISAISCAPCYKKICPINDQCMTDMDINQIFLSAKDILNLVSSRH